MPPTPPSRDRALDGARGLAILIVVLYHATIFEYAQSGFDQALVAIPRIGWSGVDLFFVLSGFLITRILLRERESPGYFKTFYARRILRIFPLYYALLVGMLVVAPRVDAFAAYNHFWSAGSAQEGVWYWLFLSNLRAGAAGMFQHELLGITWSLAIEEQFYLVWPLLVWSLSVPALRRVCWVAVVGALALRCGFLWQQANPLAVYIMTPFRVDNLAVGALIAIAARDAGGLERLRPLARIGLPLCTAAFAALATLLVVEPTTLGGHPRVALLAHPLMQSVGYSLLAAVYGLLVVQLLAAPGSWLARRFEAAWLVGLGKYSFAIYLFHPIVLWITTLQLFDPREYEWPFAAEQAIRYACALTLSFAAAWLSWHVLEAPAQRLRRFFPYAAGRPAKDA